MAGALLLLASAITMVREKIPFQQESIQRMEQGKKWALAFMLFADAHGNQLPKEFEQLGFWDTADGLSPSNWEIMSSGNLTNFANPGRTLLLREKNAIKSPGGDFTRIYVFADGHAERLFSSDSDFAALEKKRGFVSRTIRE